MTTKPSGSVDPLSQLLCEKVKVLRKKQDWTLEMLSAAYGDSRALLRQIERGKANPTLAVACRIAGAFGISIGELVEEPWSGSAIKVIRHDDPAHLYRNDDQCRIRTLSPLNAEKTVEFYQLSISAGEALRSAAHFDGTREFLTVEKGCVDVLSGKDSCILHKGDSAHYNASVPHSLQNKSKTRAEAFLIVRYQDRPI